MIPRKRRKPAPMVATRAIYPLPPRGLDNRGAPRLAHVEHCGACSAALTDEGLHADTLRSDCTTAGAA